MYHFKYNIVEYLLRARTVHYYAAAHKQKERNGVFYMVHTEMLQAGSIRCRNQPVSQSDNCSGLVDVRSWYLRLGTVQEPRGRGMFTTEAAAKQWLVKTVRD